MQLVELERGSRGLQVRTAQRLVSDALRMRPMLDLDGDFGPRTEAAVLRFQRARAIEVDGVVGRETWTALGVGSHAVPRRTGAATQQKPLPRPAPSRSPAVRPARVVAPPRTPIRPAPTRRASSSNADVARVETILETVDVPWMKVAIAEHGVHELSLGNTARIIEYHASTSLRATTDEVPWCASFVNWCLAQAGLKGTRSARAASFADWGTQIDPPRFGCIMQIYRARRGQDAATGSSSGNHVGFLVGQSASHIELLGGNQGNRVKLSRFSLASYTVRASRWPKG